MASASSKVSKLVKSLQTSTGGILSASHVVQVLDDCLDFLSKMEKNQDTTTKTTTKNNNNNNKENMQLISSCTVAIMNRFPDNAAIQERSCAVLSQLLAIVVPQEETVQAVLVALLKHEHSMLVQVNAMTALAELAWHHPVASAQRWIPDMKGLEVLQTCLVAYANDYPTQNANPKEVQLQIQGCRVVEALCCAAPANARAMASLQISQFVAAMILTKVDDDNDDNNNGTALLHYHAYRAIRALAAEVDLNREQLADTIPCILEHMQHQNSLRQRQHHHKKGNNNDSNDDAAAAYQAAACGALWNLTGTIENNQAKNVEALILHNAGKGVKVVLNCALKPYVNHVQVQETACGLLKNLTLVPDHAYAVGVLSGGVDKLLAHVLTAMRQHENSKQVQAQACGVLCHLALVDQHKAAILKAGGIGMIVAGMRRGGSSSGLPETAVPAAAEVQKSACRALKHLASISDNDTQNQISIAASGGIAAILQGMEYHADNAGVQVLGLDALQTLTAVPRNRTTMLSNHALRIIQAAVQKFGDDVFIVRVGSQLLTLLTETLLKPPPESSQ